MRHWILNEYGNPIPTDLLTWAMWFDTADGVVRQEYIGDLLVSTVFLGVDYGFDYDSPILWETMVFNKHRDEVRCERCSGNQEQAEAMHQNVVKQLSTYDHSTNS